MGLEDSIVSIPLHEGEVPHLTTEQMIEVDRAMMEDYHIELLQMMENAGRNLAHLARDRFLDGDPEGKPVAVLAGSGGNGGGALVAARRLHNWGARVQVVLAQPMDRLTPVPGHQLDILTKMRVPVLAAEEVHTTTPAALVLDGLIGYSLRGAPRGAAADLIRWANGQRVPILALDVPSGLDAGTGTVYEPAIRANATLTLALPKKGLRLPEVKALVGELYLADISVPPDLYASPSLDVSVGPLFRRADVIRLR
jgi:NAD(P)H-hydrate epimerase